MKKAICLLAMLLWTIAPASADFYQYTDQNGVIVFTDNLGEVPPEQRPRVKRVKAEPLPQAAAPVKGPEKQPAPLTSPEPEKGEDAGSVDFKALEKERKALDMIYGDLIQRRDQLREEEKALTPGQASIDHKKKVDRLNADIAAFDLRRKAFESNRARYAKEPAN